MNVSLTPKLEKFVKAQVKSGEFNNASEVVRAALRLLEERKALHRMKLKRLREELEKGEADLAAGRMLEFNDDDELAAYFARL